MKRFRLHEDKIPANRIDDVMKLHQFIWEKMGIFSTLECIYEFWEKVNDYMDAGWMNIEFTYEGDTREETLLYLMEKFGTIEDSVEDQYE